MDAAIATLDIRDAADAAEAAQRPPMEIIGVAQPIQHSLLDREARPQVYAPFGRTYQASMFVHLRAAEGGSEAAVLRSVRQELRLLDDRVRSIADGVKPSEYGRKEAFRVHQALKARGPVTVPREFVFMDRAAIGLGAVFLHLAAELNFYRLFNEAIERFAIKDVAARQAAALAKVGL